MKQYIVGYSALQKLLSVRYQNTFEVINQILEQADWTLTNAPEVLELVQYYETDGIKIANRVYETAVSALKNTYDQHAYRLNAFNTIQVLITKYAVREQDVFEQISSLRLLNKIQM